MPENQIVKQMYTEKTIFNHFYTCMIIPNYTISLLPGKKEGINASIVGGYNIGINKYISKDKLDVSLEVIKYISSKQFHKDFIVKQLGYITPLEELYDDDEVCEIINCEMLRNVQYYFRPQASVKFYNMFSSRAIENIQNLIDGELTAEEMLTNINDITRIYYLDMKSTLGIVIISVLVIISGIVIASTCFIFIPSLKSNFKFFSYDLWIIYSLGAVMMLISIYEYFDIPSKAKCLLLYQLIINGYTFIFVPLLYKLIINFPLINKISTFAINNKYLCLIGLYFIQLLLTILSFCIDIYNIKEINMLNKNKNFYRCVIDNKLGIILIITQIGYDCIMFIAIGVLIFLEWNITKIFFDIRQFNVVIIIDGITVILFLIMRSIEINSYLIYNLIFIFISFIFIIINHGYIFLGKLLILFFNKKFNESDEKVICDLIENNKIFNSETKDYSNTNSSGISSIPTIPLKNKKQINSKFILIHYTTVSQNNQDL